jgi:hypothetical protein
VTPGTRVYSSLEGKQWWTQKKKRLVKEIDYECEWDARIEYEYDSWGNVTLETWYSGDDDSGLSYGYEYDDQGRLIYDCYYGRETTYRYNEDGYLIGLTYTYGIDIDYDTTYEYDSQGNLIRESSYDNIGGSLIDKAEYEYDSRGNKTKETWYNGDGSIDTERSKTYTYEYDSRGNKAKESVYNYDGSLQEYTEYDRLGNQTKFVRYNSDGSITYGHEYEYDRWGTLMKTVDYNSDGSIAECREYTYEREYDSQGYEIKTICYSNGEKYWWSEYFYE